MSLVPSNTASSNSVLPTFFASPLAAGNGQNAAVNSPNAESDSPAFSDVLQQSGTQTDAVSSNQKPALREQSTSQDEVTGNPAATGSVVFGETAQTDPSATESISADGQTAVAFETSEVAQAIRFGKLDGNDEQDDTDVTALAATVIQRTDGAATLLDSSEEPTAIDSADDDRESESVGQYLLQPERQSQNSEESSQNGINATGEETIAAARGASESDPKRGIVGSQQQQSESLQERRSSFENEFGIRSDPTRQAGTRASVNRPGLQQQAVSLNRRALNQQQQLADSQTASSVRSDVTANGSSATITAPTEVTAFDQANSVVGQSALATESGVAVDQVNLPVTSSSSVDGATGETATLGGATVGGATVGGTTLDGATVDGAAVDGVAKTSSISDQRSEASVPAINGTGTVETTQQHAQLGASHSSVAGENLTPPEQAAVETGVEPVLASTVSPRTQKTNSEVNEDSSSEKLQSGLEPVDSIDGVDRQIGRVSGEALASQVGIDSANRFNQAGLGQSGERPLSVDLEPVSANADHVDSQEELLTESTSAADSDLDLLQQLLPRETSTVIGQSVEADAVRQEESLSLPRQIAARVIGEAEVLETGDASRFRMRLDPPELGSVMIEMQKTASGTTITVTAADPATQQLLQDSLQQLNQSGSEEASVFENLDFDLSNGDQGDSPDRDGKKSQAEKIRISGGEVAKADSEPDSQSPTELDFVA
ncbi:MAG: flagellar hook-length control protein FliK [Fuerstiella sp.]